MEVALPRSARVGTAERSPLRHVDLTLIAATAAMAIYGVFMVYSATHQTLEHFDQDPGYYLKRQAVFAVLGLAAMVVVAVVDYRWVKLYGPFLYGFCLALLVLVQTPLGSSALGAQRWFQIGAFQLSPSLFARLGLVAMMASYLSETKGELTLRDVLVVTGQAGVAMLLVFVQPDIGSSMILAGILVSTLVIAGARAKHLAILAMVAVVVLFGAFQLHIVKDYQIQRLTSFLDPQSDARAAGYNKQQAEIAIGAGGLTGRGYLKGTQTNLDFVPAQHTDFVFTVVGEELGFFGAMGLLLLYAVLLWRAYRIALLSKDPLGTFVAVGVAAMIAIQLFVNVGMTIGIMPITGIPLPFISYGGSGLIADFIGVGLLLNVHARRFL
jgi:rod shape determining protein RodA